MTLVEILIATGIGSIVAAAVMVMSFYTARSFAALANYVELDKNSRNALDVISKEIRQVDSLTSYATNKVVFSGNGGAYTLTYSYDPTAQTLTRTKTGEAARVLLTGCSFLNFSIFQRNPIGGTYDQYPTATPATCKLVQMTWICSRKIFGATANTESVQSAKVVIRKE